MPTLPRLGVIALVATAALAMLVLAVLRETSAPSGPGQVVLVPVVAIAFLAVGAVALGTRGAATACVGLAWLLGSADPALLVLHQGALLVALVTWAGGRRWLVHALVAAAAVPVALGWLDILAVATVFAATAAGVVWNTRRRERRQGTVAAAAAVIVAGTLAGLDAGTIALDARFDPGVGLLIYEAALLACAVLLTTGAVGARRGAVAEQALADSRAVGFGGLSQVLGELLGDPRLTVLPAGEAMGPSDGRVAMPVLVHGAFVAMIDHRQGLLDDAATRAAVERAVRLVAASVERRTVLEQRTAALTAARERVDSATDRRRRDVAEVLRTEVVRPLESSLATLEAAASRRAGDADVAAEVGLAAEQVSLALADVNGLVWGAPPVALGEGRLGPALRQLAQRCPLPTTWSIEDVPAPPLVEAALFYVCSEALANVQKHARATSVQVTLSRGPDGVVLTVTDDGVGGANRGGSGLAGLADRMGLVGGRLTVLSPPGGGTAVSAVIGLS